MEAFVTRLLFRTTFVGLAILLVTAGYAALGAEDSSKFDGPAELPRAYVKSALADTPAPGKSVLVKDAGELKSAIEKAACGDTIRLQAGAEFSGNFKLPAKSCDDAHWIVLRTSADDAELPREGTRLTPCYAGVASLPGRPRYTCSSASNLMPKIIFDSKGSGPLTFLEGANHYRLIGLEITRGSPGSTIYNLVTLPGDKPTHHLIFDRVWLHGTAQDETVRGILLGGSRVVAVVDSYFSDFHCVAATGSCTDAQAIAGGMGDLEMGPYKIVNNYMEGAAETIIFGGGGGTTSPADIEIRRNHMFKPAIWRQGDPNFVGGTSGKPFIVKNLFELKNAQRVLLEGNVLENSWGGFSQTGFAVLLMAKSQSNKCPACRVTDITFRYNRIAHVASGFQIATALSGDGGVSSGTERISIHDVILEDIGGSAYGGFGTLAQVTSAEPALKDVSIDHVTAFPPHALFILGTGSQGRVMSNFTFTNNLVASGEMDIVPPGGGPKNCSYQPAQQTPTGVLKSCFTNYTFSHNVIVGSKGGWPRGNSYPSDHAAAGVVGFSAGRYRLCHDKDRDCKKVSPAVRAGADGKDLGADVEAVFSATKGVE
jgi:hypothetical protein